MRLKNLICRCLIGIVFVALTACVDPVTVKQNDQIQSRVAVIDLGQRTVDVWIWTPDSNSIGTIIFSHGAASAPWKYENLIKPWVQAGYTVYAPLHVDSTDHPDNAKYQGLASWGSRLEDYKALISAYGTKGYIAAGHSYGALLALTAGGVSPLIPDGFNIAPPPDAELVLAFSPPPAFPGLLDDIGFKGLRRPAFIQTGTEDATFGMPEGWAVHLQAFEQAPENGNVYALILDGVDHYFGGAICRPELEGPKQLNELQIASDLSIEILKNYHQNSDSPGKGLEPRRENSFELRRR